jgi:hypothetical protein
MDDFAGHEDLLAFGIAFIPSPDTMRYNFMFGGLAETITFGSGANGTTTLTNINNNNDINNKIFDNSATGIVSHADVGTVTSNAIYDFSNDIKPSLGTSFADSGLAYSSDSYIIADSFSVTDSKLTSDQLQVLYEEALEREQDV